MLRRLIAFLVLALLAEPASAQTPEKVTLRLDWVDFVEKAPNCSAPICLL